MYIIVHSCEKDLEESDGSRSIKPNTEQIIGLLLIRRGRE